MFPVVAIPSGPAQAPVVRVGSQSISRATVLHWAQVLTPKLASYEPKSRADCSSVSAASYVRLSPQQQAAKLSSAQIQALCVRQKQAEVRRTMLQQLISGLWLIGEAEELGVGVSEAEAQRVMLKEQAQQFKSKVEFMHYLASSGMTEADTRLGVRVTLAGERIQQIIERRTQQKLDQAAIARYYRAHEKSFSTPETRDIRAIRTWTHVAIAKAMSEVRAGKSIADVAKRVSIDKPSNRNGGLIAGIVKGQEEAGLDQAIFAARPHVLIGPLHLRKRYYAFEVVKVSPEQRKPFKEIEDTVRTKLSEELLHQEEKSFIRAFRKKWLARTTCEPWYVVSRCREWRGPSVLDSENAYDLK
jgi:parvulin-like peptidyl-prolyl isomerase